jgi:hypothetical protein
MSDLIVIEDQVGENGELTLYHLPPGTRVRVSVEPLESTPAPQPTPEEEAAAQAELEALLNDPVTYTGLGLTAEEIARSPEIGAWAHRTDIQDSVAFIKEQRRKRRERRAHGKD